MEENKIIEVEEIKENEEDIRLSLTITALLLIFISKCI